MNINELRALLMGKNFAELRCILEYEYYSALAKQDTSGPRYRP